MQRIPSDSLQFSLEQKKALSTISKVFKEQKELNIYKKCKKVLPQYRKTLQEWDLSIIQPD